MAELRTTVPAKATLVLRRATGFLLMLILFSGVAFRVAEYANRRSLWLDEAVLAQNVLRQPVVDLALGRLTDHQVAPPGFLLATRLIARQVSADEQSLRLIPFLAGVGALGIFGWVVWKKLQPMGAVAAVMLMAWSWPLIYYSNEFKQYSTDVLIAILIFTFSQNLASRPLTKSLAWFVGLGGMVALVFSQPAVFLLGAWAIQRKTEARQLQRDAESAWWNWLGTAWVVVLGLQVGLNYGSTLGNAKLVAYHEDAFLRLWPLAEASQVWQNGVLGTWILATAESTWWLWLALLMAGLWAGWRTQKQETQIICLTLIFTALASLWHFYPLATRLLLFLLPLSFWLVGRGADWLAGWTKGRAALIPGVVLIIAVWPMAGDGLTEARHPVGREHLRPVVAELVKQAQAGDVIVVFDYTRYAFDYYWSSYFYHEKVPVEKVIFEEDRPVTETEMVAKIVPVLANNPKRVWLVATHYEEGAGQANLQLLVAVLWQKYPEAADFVPPGGTAQGLVFYRAGAAPTGKP